ncbi:hypothetical protein D3C76_1711530 [compost metagenome]
MAYPMHKCILLSDMQTRIGVKMRSLQALFMIVWKKLILGYPAVFGEKHPHKVMVSIINRFRLVVF